MPELTADMGPLFAQNNIVVSRETIEKLSIYANLLVKWQKAINLVGPATVENLITRHFIDSAQLFWYIKTPETTRLADLGSGAGFPGLVLAIMGVKDVHLVESDIRKSTFLREVSRETKTPVTVHDIRIEDVNVPNIDLITARALAPLSDLLKHAKKLKISDHPMNGLFLKGANYQEEIEKAQKTYQFTPEVHQSITDLEAKIIAISGL